jgi:uncharacterized protein
MLTALESAVYAGELSHRRRRPRDHHFRYPLFMVYLDIDRIPELMRISPFGGYNGWNWASFFEIDHFGDPALPLRQRLQDDAAAHGLELPDGPVFLLTHLRYLGYNFNPVSFFYCYGRRGRLEAILAEVNNTFGESHNYWLSERNEVPTPNSRRYRCPKSMHVSPFMGMGLDYEFVFTEPAASLVVRMKTIEHGEGFFDATLSLERRPWSAASLHRALLRHPWMTAKVIWAIHWEALLLYIKRVPVHTHPARIRREGAAETGR